MDDTAFLDKYLNSKLEKEQNMDPEKLKTLLAYIGLERLKKVKNSQYSEQDLKVLAGEVIS